MKIIKKNDYSYNLLIFTWLNIVSANKNVLQGNKVLDSLKIVLIFLLESKSKKREVKK
jgi:hypothetical protein